MACTAVETADTAAAPLACTTPVETACTAPVETAPAAPAVPSPDSDSESDSSDSEMDISGLEVGMVVLAKGYGPAGGRSWFRARITKFRPRFPPIVVTFTATHPEGLTQPLLLPQPKVAHVTRADIRLLDEEPDAPAAPRAAHLHQSGVTRSWCTSSRGGECRASATGGASTARCSPRAPRGRASPSSGTTARRQRAHAPALGTLAPLIHE